MWKETRNSSNGLTRLLQLGRGSIHYRKLAAKGDHFTDAGQFSSWLRLAEATIYCIFLLLDLSRSTSGREAFERHRMVGFTIIGLQMRKWYNQGHHRTASYSRLEAWGCQRRLYFAAIHLRSPIQLC